MTDEISLAKGWNNGYLTVPLNEQGQKDYDNWLSHTSDLFHVALRSEDYYALEHVFWEWNDEFDLLIDMYEDEEIRCEIAPKALALLERHIEERKDDQAFQTAAEKLKKALTKAIEVGRSMYMDF